MKNKLTEIRRMCRYENEKLLRAAQNQCHQMQFGSTPNRITESQFIQAANRAQADINGIGAQAMNDTPPPTVPSDDDIRTKCDWPIRGYGQDWFSFHDEPGEHDPCYVVMPGGSQLELNHHAGEGVDIARAKFIIEACNAALSRPAPARTDVPEKLPVGERYKYTGTTPEDHRKAIAKAFRSARNTVGYCEMHMAAHPVLSEILDVLHPDIVRGEQAFTVLQEPARTDVTEAIEMAIEALELAHRRARCMDDAFKFTEALKALRGEKS